jgi:hypothetical protein
MGIFKIDENELEKNKKILGDELGVYYSYIYNDVYGLIYQWQEYKELFNKSQTRIELINKSTGSFFWLIQKTMLSSIILTICRLTDEIKPSRIDKTHLSIYIIPKNLIDVDFKREINMICSLIRKNVREIRNERDNYLAHTDLDTLKAGKAFFISFDDIDICIDLFYQVIRLISNKYFESDITKSIISPLNGADTLLQIINEGIIYREKKSERIMNGNYSEEDIHWPRI